MKSKLQPAALALLRAKREAVEQEFIGQVRQLIAAGQWVHGDPEPQFSFSPSRRWRYDFAWPQARLVVDIDGGTYSGGAHARGGGIENDREKDAHAVIDGWRVLRVTTKQVKDWRAVEWVGRILGREKETTR